MGNNLIRMQREGKTKYNWRSLLAKNTNKKGETTDYNDLGVRVKKVQVRNNWNICHRNLRPKREKTFFNKDWSKAQIEEAVITGYKEATEKGISSGQYTFSFSGEIVTIALENGKIKTAFGSYKYTYQQLLELSR